MCVYRGKAAKVACDIETMSRANIGTTAPKNAPMEKVSGKSHTHRVGVGKFLASLAGDTNQTNVVAP